MLTMVVGMPFVRQWRRLRSTGDCSGKMRFYGRKTGERDPERFRMDIDRHKGLVLID